MCIFSKLEPIYLVKIELEVKVFVLFRKENKRKRVTCREKARLLMHGY